MNKDRKDIKKFLLRFVIFLSPLLITFLFLEYNLLLIPNNYSFKKANLIKKASQIELLILGSSNAEVAINPSLFSVSGFNLAKDSQSFYYDWMLLANNISSLPNLKMVIIPVSYLSFEYSLSESPGNSMAFFYDRYYKIPPELKEPSFDFDLRKYSLVALYGVKDSLSYASKSFQPNLVEVDENGYFAYVKYTQLSKDRISDNSGIRRINYHHSFMNPQFIPRNIRYLENIISLLKSKGIKPIIITTPVYHTYYDHLNWEKYQAMQEAIKDIQQKYQVEYLNYLKDPRFTIEDFGDNDHLNVAGAKKFSTILNDEVIKE